MGFKIPRINPKVKMPKTIRTSISPIGGRRYRGGVPDERSVDDWAGPASRPVRKNTMGNFGTGLRSVETPSRLEVRRVRSGRATPEERADFMDQQELAEYANTNPRIANLRRLLARKGATYEPTGGTPYSLAGGDLGVPSFGVNPRGWSMSAKEQLKLMKRNKAYRGAR